jgi:hypothetical protein
VGKVHYERIPIKGARRYEQGGDVDERPVLGLGRSAPEPEADYDYAAAQRAGVGPDERGHMPDTYKLPNHITFSDESMYHGDENEGGHWSQLADDRWSFTPGPANLQHHSMQEMRDYFKRYEPDAVFMPGQQYQKGGAAPADDANALTDEDRAAIQKGWLEVVEDSAHQGRMHYTMPNVAGMAPPGSFRIPKDVFAALGDGDLKTGGAVVHGMFGIEDDPADPTLIHGDVVRIIGNGSLAAGWRVLERFVQQVRHGARGGVTLHYTGREHDDDHGWRIVRR